MSILDKEPAMEDHWADNPRFKKTAMTKEDALKIIKLLSALESWAFSTKNPLPEYLTDELFVAIKALDGVVLGKKP